MLGSQPTQPRTQPQTAQGGQPTSAVARGQRATAESAGRRRLLGDDRGVSEMVSAMLTVSLALLAGVGMVSVGMYISESGQSLQTASTLEETGSRLSGAIEAMDRQVGQSKGQEPISRELSLPESAGGGAYSIEVLNSADAAAAPACGPPADTPNVGCIVLRPAEASGEQFPVTTYFTTGSTTITSTAVDGGPVVLVREQGGGSTIRIEQR